MRELPSLNPPRLRMLLLTEVAAWIALVIIVAVYSALPPAAANTFAAVVAISLVVSLVVGLVFGLRNAIVTVRNLWRG